MSQDRGSTHSRSAVTPLYTETMAVESFERRPLRIRIPLTSTESTYFVRLVWSNKDTRLPDPCQRLALLVKYTHVERGVHRGEMTTFCVAACRQASSI